MSSTRFFTNEDENTLLAKFAGVFAHNPDLARFDALVGYLRASGWFALRPHLERVPKVRLLVGINVDAHLARRHREGLLLLADAGRARADVRRALRDDLAHAPYDPTVEAGLRGFAADVAAGRVEVRAHPTRRLHAKFYVFLPPGFSEHRPGAVITGSSNLTAAGLGADPAEARRNYECNVLLHDHADVRFAADEFERLWAESVEILPEMVGGVLAESHLREDLTPFDLYLKFLLEYFGPAIAYDPNSETDLPRDYKNLSYQTDAVNDGWLKLEKHGGFFLADVVGLGKTVVATRIAKKFYFHNGFPAYRSRILVVPPTLVEPWRTALERFHIDDSADVLTNGSLHKISAARAERYDLIIVDEAHKFRNDAAGGYDLLQRLCKTPTRRQRPDGTFAAKRVILVSATPLNNRPEDIRNLVLLFQDGKDSTVLGNLQGFFARRIKEYDAARRLPDPVARHAAIAAVYGPIRERVIAPLTVRRTRRDLLEDRRFKADLDAQGICFPRVEKPTPIFYTLPPALDALYDRTVRLLTEPAESKGGLTYARYRAIAFLAAPELRARYERAELIATQLAAIMKTLLVKRLDSSFVAFTKSLRRFRDATAAMVEMFARGRVYLAPNLHVSDYILDNREDELLAAIATASETDPTITVAAPDDFRPSFLDGLRHDAAVLDELVAAWEQHAAEDPKLEEFLRRLRGELLAPGFNETGRLVIFSEARDTTAYLAERLDQAGFGPVLTVDSHNRKAVMPAVRANFDANVPHDPALRRDDYRLLISTEVLAEGVNLHRAHVIVNYDTPWNSTRLMQRIGRVNRIGTTAEVIHIFNFYPTAQVNRQIELEQKAKLKLFAFHAALGEDSGIYSPDESPESFGLFDRAVEEERDERQRFLTFLRDYREAHPDEFRRVKHLPLRARCGRAADATPETAARAGASLVFLRNERRDAFLRVGPGPDDPPVEIGFAEMERAFRAEVAERSVPLPETHHAHVRAALADFHEKLQADAARERAVDHTLGPNEAKAIRLLAAAGALPNLAPSEKALLLAAQDAVRLARFQELPRKLNKFHREATGKTGQPTVVLAVYLEKLLAILRAYPLGAEQDEDDADTASPPDEAPTDLAAFQPRVILSESFAANAPVEPASGHL